MVKKACSLQPKALYLLILSCQFLILLLLLVPIFDSTLFLLFLFISFSLVLRWRIHMNPIYMLVDQTFFIVLSFFYPIAALYLFIMAYYFSYKNKLIYIIPTLIIGVIVNSDMLFYILVLQAVLFGTLIYYWEKERQLNNETNDHLRQHIYELESMQTQLLSDYQDTERLSRLTERKRIAEVLHDSLGHELTAAHLSLKAYQTLLASNQLKLAEVTLNKSVLRLENAIEQLKDSVKQIEPHYEMNLTHLKHLCENFIYPVQLDHTGDVTLEPYIWQLILMSVKEALTNITKHAKPDLVQITFDVTDYIVRLVIENDGIYQHINHIKGNGLRYMRNRLEAVNGSLSIQNQATFKLIMIIPKGVVS
jgi:signal transduction histidine kinase